MTTTIRRPAMRRPRAVTGLSLAFSLALAAVASAPAAAAASGYNWQWDNSEAAIVTALSNRSDDGYMIIVNNDNSEMSLDINVDSRTIYLRRDRSGQGMFTLPDGAEFPLRVRKGEYKLYWGVGMSVEVKVRSRQTTTLAFDAYGRDGQGLRAIVHDGERLREYTLYESDAAYRQQILQETYAVRDGRRHRVIVTSTPVVVTETVYVPKPPSVQLWVGGAIRVFDAISRLVGDNKHYKHDSRHGYDYRYSNNKWKRINYGPASPVVSHAPKRPAPAPAPTRPGPSVATPPRHNSSAGRPQPAPRAPSVAVPRPYSVPAARQPAPQSRPAQPAAKPQQPGYPQQPPPGHPQPSRR